MVCISMCECAGICLCLMIGGFVSYYTRTECCHYKEMEQHFLENK